MAIIKCPECGKEISDQSKRCVHCGYKLKKPRKKTPKAIGIIGLVLLILDVLTIALLEFGPEDISKYWYLLINVDIALFFILFVSLIFVFVYYKTHKKIKTFLLILAVLIPIMAVLGIGGKNKCERYFYEYYENRANSEERFNVQAVDYNYAKKTDKYGVCCEFLGDNQVAITEFGYYTSHDDGKTILPYTLPAETYTYSFKTNWFGIRGLNIDDGTRVYLTNKNGHTFEYGYYFRGSYASGGWSTEGRYYME